MEEWFEREVKKLDKFDISSCSLYETRVEPSFARE